VIFDGLEPGTFRTIVVDAPWPYPVTERFAGKGRKSSAHASYGRMTMEDLTAMPVASLAHPDGCLLWAWITNARLLSGDHVPLLAAWGFEPVTMCTWAKTGRAGLGRYVRGATEHLILARRGWGLVPEHAAMSTWFTAPRGRHSVKPDAAYDLIEQVSPPPRADIFAREPRLGWSSWGHGFRSELEAESA
jgi:N6-adenosine-specific RNA methylase IME4